jgi:hypothetical protein
MTTFPDIKEILLYQRYENFPLFVPIDKQLEWIEQFEPYLSPQRFLKNKVEEFELLQSSLNESQSALLLRLYQKFLSTLATLSSHKGILLQTIKEEYDQLQAAYLKEDNETNRYQTLADLLNEHNLEIRYDTFLSELVLVEHPSTILMVPYQNQLCLIKRSYLEYFREDPNEKYIDPISDYCIQELMEIPIDTQSILDGLSSGTFCPDSLDTLDTKSTKTIVELIAKQLDSTVYPSESVPISSTILFRPSAPLLSEITFDSTPHPIYLPIEEIVFKPIEPEQITESSDEPKKEEPTESPAPIVEIKPVNKPTLSTGPRHLTRLRTPTPMKSSMELLKQVYKPATPNRPPITSSSTSTRPPLSFTSSKPPLPGRKPTLSTPSIPALKAKPDPNLLAKRAKNFK